MPFFDYKIGSFLADFLITDKRQQKSSFQICPFHLLHSSKNACSTAFHVARSPSIQFATDNFTAERIVLPFVSIAHRNSIYVTIEHQATSLSKFGNHFIPVFFEL